MRTIDGGNLSSARGFAYPIAVDEDVEYVGTNFSQDLPHTDGVFAVAPGVRLRLVDCNLVNVKVPDGGEIIGGNLLHGILANTGDSARPQVRLLCECAKCCVYRRILNLGNLPRDDGGRVKHHLLKDVARARRESATDLSDDRTWQAASNAAAMTRFGRTVTAQLQASLGRGT